MTDHRRAFLEQIRQGGVSLSPQLAAAFGTVRREAFVPDGFQRRDGTWATPADPDFLATVYRDDVLVTKVDGRIPVSSSSQPSLMALMIEALRVRPGHRVLEIGAGTGYNAALLATLGASVTSIDVQKDVADRARSALARANITGVRVEHADGYAGHPGEPFDRIVVTVGVAGLSPNWTAQLSPGGLIVAPVEHAGTHPVLVARVPEPRASGPQPSASLRRPEVSSGDSAAQPAPGILHDPVTADSGPAVSSGASASRSGGGILDGPVTARVICPAGFMTAAGPLSARYPGAHPPPATTTELTGFTLAGPPRFDPPLEPIAYRDLWYAAGTWSRRATHATVPRHDREQSCLALLDDTLTGGALILPDGTVLSAGPEAPAYATEATTVLDRWLAAGRPPMHAWHVTLSLTGDPQAPIWAPTTWHLTHH